MTNLKDLVHALQPYYKKGFRSMPWRSDTRPYYILVSELMLQQTQVDRVIPKFKHFTQLFPTINDLAAAPLSEVITAWSGLGYNRRAKFLHESAKKIQIEFSGEVPDNVTDLVSLPGIGPNTAGAIMAYAYNKPIVFIETNIRAVFIYHFFADKNNVADTDILKLVESYIDTKNPRRWYWALMDYGTHLKKTTPNPSRKSRSHVKQSAFEGSKRRIRGIVLKALIEKPHTHKKLQATVADKRLGSVLEGLIIEGLIDKDGDSYKLSD